jgi:ABC-type dipeptide/oligopeptide/nickel transport system permease component
MPRFILRRLGLIVVVLIGITLITFTLSHVIPGNPALLIAGKGATPRSLAQIRHEYGLSGSLPSQYLKYISGLLHGNLGISTYSRRPVIDDLGAYIPATLELVLFAAFIVISVGVPLGVVSAIRPGGVIDNVGRVVAIAGSSLPLFWLGLVLQLILGGKLHLLPLTGRLSPSYNPPPTVTGMYTLDSLFAGQFATFANALEHILLPAVTLAFASLSMVVRVTRASMLEALGQDYIRTAETKGLTRRRVIVRHALRNALMAPFTLFVLQFGYLLSGVFFVEVVFSWPGIGSYTVNAVGASDYQAIMGVTLFVAVSYSMLNLLADLVYLKLDPRISYGR